MPLEYTGLSLCEQMWAYYDFLGTSFNSLSIKSCYYYNYYYSLSTFSFYDLLYSLFVYYDLLCSLFVCCDLLMFCWTSWSCMLTVKSCVDSLQLEAWCFSFGGNVILWLFVYSCKLGCKCSLDVIVSRINFCHY